MPDRDNDLTDLMHRCLDGTADAAAIARLNDRLRTDAAARAIYLELADLHACLAVDESLWAAASDPVPVAQVRASRKWRPWGAAAAGLVIGLVTATMLSGLTAERPMATEAAVPELANAGFEASSGRVASGFPAQPSIWSGDDLEVTGVAVDEEGRSVQPAEGGRMLRFVRPKSDPNTQNGRAISCDVFQLVDLRALRGRIPADCDAVLELSAAVLDARRGAPSTVSFLCKVSTYHGDPVELQRTWPEAERGALSLGAAHHKSSGGPPDAWQTIGTRCILPAGADYALIHLAARPDGSATVLESIYADEVRLTLKVQPRLPVRQSLLHP
jgi:hypothetical protein